MHNGECTWVPLDSIPQENRLARYTSNVEKVGSNPTGITNIKLGSEIKPTGELRHGL